MNGRLAISSALRLFVPEFPDYLLELFGVRFTNVRRITLGGAGAEASKYVISIGREKIPVGRSRQARAGRPAPAA